MNTAVTFPLVVSLMRFDIFRENVLLGIIPYLGANQLLVMESGNALLDYVKQLKKSYETENNNGTHELVKTAEAILSIFKSNQKHDRIVTPLLKVVSHLLSHDCFRNLQPSQYG